MDRAWEALLTAAYGQWVNPWLRAWPRSSLGRIRFVGAPGSSRPRIPEVWEPSYCLCGSLLPPSAAGALLRVPTLWGQLE